MKQLEQFIDKIICGDALETLKQIPSNSIDCIITSPPYWGLRDYGKEACKVWDGESDCQHEWEIQIVKHDNLRPSKVSEKTIVGSNKELRFRTGEEVRSAICKKCGAWYGQLGLEPTLDMYIEHLLQITAELKRVLKPTGVMFWVHNDCYGGSGCGKGDYRNNNKRSLSNPNLYCEKPNPQRNLKQKCMVLQNYRLILRMIDEQGWILRNIIIWHKPNHMPSSAKDRFTNAYEPVFMLTKSKKYWFDLDAVRVPHKDSSYQRVKYPMNHIRSTALGLKNATGYSCDRIIDLNPLGKNPGDLWSIPTEGFRDAHFAVFPTKLVEPMIKAGCPKQVCKKCGKPRERIVKIEVDLGKRYKDKTAEEIKAGETSALRYKQKIVTACTISWSDCGCNAGWRAGVVLDPFCGSGTTCYVARKLGRHFIGIEINPKYVEMARKRLSVFPARLDNFFEELEVKCESV